MKLGALESWALMIWLNVNENGGFRNCRTDFADDRRQRSPHRCRRRLRHSRLGHQLEVRKHDVVGPAAVVKHNLHCLPDGNCIVFTADEI